MTTMRGRTRRRSRLAPVITVVLMVWLAIGVLAAGQRHYLRSQPGNCAKASTVAVTVLAGPLNYVGVNPKLTCHLPQPSK